MNQCANVNKICHICGLFTIKKQARNLSPDICENYKLYFGFELVQSVWSPNICCGSCSCNLRNWRFSRGRGLKFGVPMIWSEPKPHDGNCFFCQLPNLTGKKATDRHKIVYPSVKSVQLPIPHNNDLPVPAVPEEGADVETDREDVDTYEVEDDFEDDPSFVPQDTDEIHKPSQEELNDFCRDLNLPKDKSEMLVSRLKQWNLAGVTAKSSAHRTRDLPYSKFFTDGSGLIYCTDLDGLMKEMKIDHDPSEWRLFLDSSMKSFKVVLLHNGNTKPTIPIAYSTTMKETYENCKTILNAINYNQYRWLVCCDLKMVHILLGLQAGFIKFCCFLCKWDSRARANHYIKRDWPLRETFVVGNSNVIYEPLVDAKKIVIPPLHEKLGIFSNWVKALDTSKAGFQYLIDKFPKKSEAKVKAGIFNGPEIRTLLADERFTVVLENKERDAWESFKSVCQNFLGNHRAENYKELVERMLVNFKDMGVLMSPKIHLIHNHLDCFPPNCGDFSDEMGERFHQDLSQFENWYQGKVGPRMLGEYCWMQCRDLPDNTYNRMPHQRPRHD